MMKRIFFYIMLISASSMGTRIAWIHTATTPTRNSTLQNSAEGTCKYECMATRGTWHTACTDPVADEEINGARFNLVDGKFECRCAYAN